jgi:hypothetical protein
MTAISRMAPPHPGHSMGNSSPTRAISFARAIREVSCAGLLMWVAAARGMRIAYLPTGRVRVPLADVPDGERCDGFPQPISIDENDHR